MSNVTFKSEYELNSEPVDPVGLKTDHGEEFYPTGQLLSSSRFAPWTGNGLVGQLRPLMLRC
jgi:hypothetical protein